MLMLDSVGRRAPGRVTYRLRNGLDMTVRSASGDVSILYETWVLDSYSPPEFHLPPDAIVLDVGAHVGTFAVRAAHESPRGHVYAFEPTSENSALLRENIARNRLTNLTVVQAAVGAKPGRATIALDDANTGMHSLYASTSGKRAEEVEVVTLDDVIDERKLHRVDLLKLDCEGAEYDIILGASRTTLALIQRLAVEYHAFEGAPGPEAIESRLKAEGFRVRRDDAITPMLYAWRDERAGAS